jgi:hypothetical protein
LLDINPHKVIVFLGLQGLIVLLQVLQAAVLLEVLLHIELALVDDVDCAEEVIGIFV